MIYLDGGGGAGGDLVSLSNHVVLLMGQTRNPKFSYPLTNLLPDPATVPIV